MEGVVIRHAKEEDFDQIAAIYAYHVLHGTGSFEVEPVSTEEMKARWHKVVKFGSVYLVAEKEGKILGYCYAGPYHVREAFKNTLEDSVYIHPECPRCGLGTVLLTELLKQCTELGFKQMISVIGDSQNFGSINLHKKLGFIHQGNLVNVGYKFNRWLDVVLMQKTMNPCD